MTEAEICDMVDRALALGQALGNPWSVCELDLSAEQRAAVRRAVFNQRRDEFLARMSSPQHRRNTAFLLLLAWCDSCADSAMAKEVWKCLAAQIEDPGLKHYLQHDPRRYDTVADEILRLAEACGLRHVPRHGPVGETQWMYTTIRMNHAISVPMLRQVRQELTSVAARRLLDPTDPLHSPSFQALRKAIESRNAEAVEHSAWISPEAAADLVEGWKTSTKPRSQSDLTAVAKVRHRLRCTWQGGVPRFFLELDPEWRIAAATTGRADLYIGDVCLGEDAVQIALDGCVDSFGREFEVDASGLDEPVSLWRREVPVAGSSACVVPADLVVFDGQSGGLLSAATPRRPSRPYVVGSFLGTVPSDPTIDTVALGGRSWFLLRSGWPASLVLRYEGLDVLRGTTDEPPGVCALIVGDEPRRRNDTFRLKVEAAAPYRVAVVRPADDTIMPLGFADPPTNRLRKYRVGRLGHPRLRFFVELESKGYRRIVSVRLELSDYLDVRFFSTDDPARLPFDGSLVVEPVCSGAASAELTISQADPFPPQLLVGRRPVRWSVPTGVAGKASLRVGAETFALADRLEAPGWLRSVDHRETKLDWELPDGLVPDLHVLWTDQRFEAVPGASLSLVLDEGEEPLGLAAVSGREIVGLWLEPGMSSRREWHGRAALPAARWFGVLPTPHPKGWRAALDLAEAEDSFGLGRSSWFDARCGDLLQGVTAPDLSESVRLIGTNWPTAARCDARLGVGVLTALKRLDPLTRLRALDEFGDGEARSLPDIGLADWSAQRATGEGALRAFEAMARGELGRLRREEAAAFAWLADFESRFGSGTLPSMLEALAQVGACPTKHRPFAYLVRGLLLRHEQLASIGPEALRRRLQGLPYDDVAVRRAIAEQEAFSQRLQAILADVEVYTDEPWLELAGEVLANGERGGAVTLQGEIDDAFDNDEATPLVDAALHRLAQATLGQVQSFSGAS